jgi:YaiO family outer membrane protein
MKPVINRLIPVLVILVLFVLNASAQQTDSLKQEIRLSYNLTNNDEPVNQHWHLGSLEYKLVTGFGPLIGRVNYGNRLGSAGVQFEADAYPKISKKIYNYISIGVSSAAPVFPKLRAGYSFYLNLPHGIETEAGIRYLKFDDDVFIYTGGISKYLGNWLINARTFIAPSRDQINQSYFLTVRKYSGKEPQNYSWLQAGYGISPDENRNIVLFSSTRLSSSRISAGLQQKISKRFNTIAELGFARNEIEKSNYSYQYFGTIGIGKRF